MESTGLEKKKRGGKVTASQLEMLVSYLEENRTLTAPSNLANDDCAKDRQQKWDVLTTMLNVEVGPNKTRVQWQKCWTDLKSKTKQQAGELVKEMRKTGGGPPKIPPLTPLQERIKALVGNDSVEGCGGPRLPLNPEAPKENLHPEEHEDISFVILQVPEESQYEAQLTDGPSSSTTATPSPTFNEITGDKTPKRTLTLQGSASHGSSGGRANKRYRGDKDPLSKRLPQEVVDSVLQKMEESTKEQRELREVMSPIASAAIKALEALTAAFDRNTTVIQQSMELNSKLLEYLHATVSNSTP